MPVPENTTTNEATINVTQADVSTPTITYMGVASSGRLVRAAVSISAAITLANSVVTVKRYPAGVASAVVTCGTITIAFTGSAIGSCFQFVPTGTESACIFAPGDTLVVDNDGGSTTTSIGNFSFVLRG